MKILRIYCPTATSLTSDCFIYTPTAGHFSTKMKHGRVFALSILRETGCSIIIFIWLFVNRKEFSTHWLFLMKDWFRKLSPKLVSMVTKLDEIWNKRFPTVNSPPFLLVIIPQCIGSYFFIDLSFTTCRARGQDTDLGGISRWTPKRTIFEALIPLTM